MDYKYLKPFVLLFFLLCSILVKGQVANGISTSVGNTSNQTICAGDTVTIALDLVSGVGQGYIIYRVRGGVTDTVKYNNATPTFTTSNIQDGDVYYGERFDYDFSATPIPTSNITFTVLTLTGPSFTGGTIDQPNQFICSGFPGTNLSVTGGTVGPDYALQWQRSTDAGTTYTDIPLATGETYNTGSVNTTTYFRRRVMHTGGGTCEQFSSVFINEISDLDPGSLDTSIDTRICYDTSPGTLGIGASTAPTASRGAIAYQWQQNVNGSGWTDIAGATNLTYTPPNLTQDTQFRRFAINSDSNTGSNCSFSTNAISIDVEVQIIPGTTMGTQTICNGDIPATLQLTGATSVPGIVYEWQASTDGVNFTDIGVSGNFLTFTATSPYTPIFTTYYRARVGTLSPSCNEFSSVTTVTVLPENVTLSSDAVDGVYCTGDVVEFTATGSVSLFEFYLDGFLFSRSASPTISFPSLTGTHTISLIAITAGNCSRRIDMTIVENNVDPGVISGDQLVCAGVLGQTVSSITPASANGLSFNLVPTSAYQWQSSTDGSSWNPIIGATQADFMVPSSLSTSIYLRRLASNTIGSASCSAISNEILIDIIPAIQGGTVNLSDQVLCVTDAAIPLTISGSTSATNISYQWEEAAYPSGAFTSIPGAEQASYTPAPSVTTRYRRMTYSGSTSSCSALSTEHVAFIVDLDPGSLDPSQNNIITQGNTPGTIGNGTTGSDASSSNASIIYQWEQSVDNGTSWITIVGATNNSYSPPALAQTTLYRRKAIASFSGTSCEDVTNVITITVTTILNAGNVFQSQTLCNALFPNALVLTGATSNTFIDYVWEMSPDDISYTPIANTSEVLSFTAATTAWNPPLGVTYYRVRVTDTGNGNFAFSGAASITILSPVSIALTSDSVGDVFCDGEIPTFTATPVPSTTYEFFINNISVQGDSANNTFTPATSLSGNTTVTVISTFGAGCSVRTDLLVQQNSLSPGSISGTQSRCFGETPSTLVSVLSGSVNGLLIPTTATGNYQWQSSSDNVVWNDILSATGTTYSPPGLSQDTYFRRKVVSTINGHYCEDLSNSILISVTPELIGGNIFQTDQIVCANEIPMSLTVSNSTSFPGLSYQWQQSIDFGGTFTNIPAAVDLSYDPPTISRTTQYRRVVFSSAGAGCMEYSSVHTIELNDVDPGSLDANQSTNICYNTTPGTLSSGVSGSNASSSVGIVSYQWQQAPNNISWTDIPLATAESYTPDALTQDMFYRRVASSTYASLTCSDTTNSILISVYDEVVGGTVIGDQIICEGTLPTTLNLTGIVSPTDHNFQWQQSNDNVVFTNLSNTLASLAFDDTTTWNPSVTTYYRVLVSNPASPGCTATSTVAEIRVDPRPTITQIAGPGPLQLVCAGDPIIDAVFEFDGTASGLSISGITGSGLTFTVSGTNYVLSGTPSGGANLTITANGISPCTSVNYQYTVSNIATATTPDYIRMGTDDVENTVFEESGLWYNNTRCQNIGAGATSVIDFFVCSSDVSITPPVYEWSITPGAAGSIDVNTGQVTLNNAFSGTVTISVRELSCGGNSDWLDTQIQIVPETLPATPATALSPPEAFDLNFCGETTGASPECQITSTTPDTRYFSTALNGISDYQSIQWSIQNVVPGGGITGVGNPGTIDSATGVVEWNSGFWGSLNIQAQAINCDGSPGVTSFSTVHIAQEDTTSPNILTQAPTYIPSCPPTGSYVTQFRSDQSVTWSLDNVAAGVITSLTSDTGQLTWANDFSGSVRILATGVEACDTGVGQLYAIIPGEATLDVNLGLDDVFLCQGSFLNGIEYRIGGFPNSALASNLPDGITGVFTSTHHIVDIEYFGSSTRLNERYMIETHGQTHFYDTQTTADSAHDVATGLAAAINADASAQITATVSALNTLQIRAKVAGFVLSGTIFGVTGGVIGQATASSGPDRTLTLTGTVTADPGVYDYTVTTSGGEVICNNVSAIGRITVTALSTATLATGSDDDQTLCVGASITPIVYDVEHALFAQAFDLPDGVVSSYSTPTGLVISGTPSDNVALSTIYTYTVRTFNNRNGCSPEVELTGTITVEPNASITLASALGTDNQTICNEGSLNTLTNIQYQLGGSASGFTESGLPDGISATYDPFSRLITISGAPTSIVNIATTYPYTISTTDDINCAGDTIAGSITVIPSSSLTLTSALGTDDQSATSAICVGTMISPISYEFGQGATSAFATGLPPGVDYTISGTTLTISGIANPGTTATTVYNYQVRTVGNSCEPEAILTGRIEVIPTQLLELVSAAGTDNQEICNSGTANALIPIEYVLQGSTTGFTETGLPAGISATLSPTNRTITIAGTPTFELNTTTSYPYTLTPTGVPGCTSFSISGVITIHPNSKITLLSASGTDNQTGVTGVCQGSAITPISYTFSQGATSASVSGLPNGVTYSISGSSINISGTPSDPVTVPTEYTYTVTTSGNECQPEATVMGVIEVLPLQSIQLSSGAGTDQQTICNSGTANPLTPIQYLLGGSATGFTQIGLPSGISAVLNPTNRIITISGIPSVEYTTMTTLPYMITTTGLNCSPITVIGEITIIPNASLALTSALGTDNQTGADALCVGNAITPITYEFEGNAAGFTVSGLPSGVNYSQSGNSLTISGSPLVTVIGSTVFSYTVETTGSFCAPEASISGTIEVTPNPIIDKAFIEANDINHISCPGGNDGSIIIPDESPDLDLRIGGGISPQAQLSQISFTNQPALGDVYAITVNGINYSHTVINSTFGGTTQTLAEVTQALVDLINEEVVGKTPSAVTASLLDPTTIRLGADTPGIAFTLAANISSSIIPPSSVIPSYTITAVRANVDSSYSYRWSGPNGFSSSSLSIINLEPGTYTLEVTIGNCVNTESFIILDSDPITATNDLCNGALQTEISGGTAPYLLNLFDSGGNLVSTRNTQAIASFTDLTPGANYLLEITDAQCSNLSQFSISVPFELGFNAAFTSITPDYCRETPSDIGGGSIQLATNSGVAFTGGSNDYSYSWSGPNVSYNTRDIFNLVPGSYTVTVLDRVLGCTAMETFVIPTIDALNLTLATGTVFNSAGAIELSCNGDTDALIGVNITGGSGNYQYSWEKDGFTLAGETTSRLQNLGPGTYKIIVTNIPPNGIDPNNLCQLVQEFDVVEPEPLSVAIDPNGLPTTACQDTVFSLPVVISGGTPPYQLNLNSGFQTSSTSSLSYTFENIELASTGGMLSLGIVDANNCSFTATTVLVPNVTESYKFSTLVTNIDCRNDVLGGLQLNSTPSIPASTTLIIQWQSADLNLYDTWDSSNGILTGLTAPGNYRVSVSTPDGCLLYNEEFVVEDLSNEALEVNIVKEQGLIDCLDEKGRIELEIKNGIPPFTIRWEKLGVSTTTWTELTALRNNAIVTNLDAGTYRATVENAVQSNTANLCLTEIRTRNIVLKEEQFAITNVSSSTASACDLNNSAGGTLSFRLLNTLSNPDNLVASNTFSLDGVPLSLGSSNFTFDQQINTYTITGISAGFHTLVIQENNLSNCIIEQEFTIPDDATPIVFNGIRDFMLDVCTSSIELNIEPSDVSGGIPYNINGEITYEYSWEFNPVTIPGEPEGVVGYFVGDQILNAEAGTYILTITDSANCTNDSQDPIVITIAPLAELPFSVQGALTDADGNVVFATPDNCSDAGDNGTIGIEVMGGLRPYETRWFYQEPGVQAFEEQVELRNKNIISNSPAGVYRYEISSLQDSCPDTATADERLFTYLEGTIVLDPNPDLYILSGPFIENQDLCNGLPGKITVEVFDNNQGELFFYYEDILLEKDDDQRTPNTYTLFIENPVDSGFLRIENEEGCTIEKKIDLALGEASFTFTSVSKEASGVILARENVTFENTSALPYSHFEFYYGDNSEPYLSREDTTSATVTVNRIPPHQYPTSGTYNAILKVYNNSGCFSEEVLPVPVGNGYSIQLPNVFTPNNDGVNDVFRPLTSGLTKIEFSIYDYNGSLIYTETVVSDSDSFVKLEETLNDGGIKGWDGADASPSPYYVYSVRGTLADEVTQVERSGTFTLIR